MANYLSNAFSANMINVEDFSLVRFKRIKPEEIPCDVTSAIGHVDTAAVVSSILGFEVRPQRIDVHLTCCKDTLYLAQYRGPRLPEGCTTLPEGATLEFYEVSVSGGCSDCPAVDCQMCGMSSWLHGN